MTYVLLDRSVVLSIHEEQLAVHGGGVGIRDEGLLESALARPENKLAYDPKADCADLAAAYGFGLARNHPFIDGNKRTAFVALELCLALNGFRLTATNEEVVITMLQLAAGNLDEEQLVSWIRRHLAKL